MNIQIKEGVLIILPHGNLLSDQNSTSIVDLIKTKIESGISKVLFNLREVNFMNSSGLDMLLTALTKTKALGGEVALCCLPEQTKKLLQITRLNSVFMVFAKEENAISYLTRDLAAVKDHHP